MFVCAGWTLWMCPNLSAQEHCTRQGACHSCLVSRCGEVSHCCMCVSYWTSLCHRQCESWILHLGTVECQGLWTLMFSIYSLVIIHFSTIFRHVCKIVKSDCMLRHVHLLSVSMEQLDLHWMDFDKIRYLSLAWKSVKIQILLKSDRSECFTQRCFHIYGNISLNSS